MREENLSMHFAMIEILPRIYEPQRFLNSTKNTKNVSKCLRLKFDKNDNGHKSLMYRIGCNEKMVPLVKMGTVKVKVRLRIVI